MATPRKRYFRMADAILHEGWDKATVGEVALLSAWLNTRWAREGIPAEEAGRAWMSPYAVLEVSRCCSQRAARACLTTLPERSGINMTTTVERHGGVLGIAVDWPKFHVFQGYKRDDLPDVGEISGKSRGNLGAKNAPSLPRPATPDPRPATYGAAQNEIDPAYLPLLDAFVVSLRVAESRAGFAALTSVGQLQRTRLLTIAGRVGDRDPAAWDARVRHAVATRQNRGNGDCGWIWAGKEDDAALRWEQLASGPLWHRRAQEGETQIAAPASPMRFDAWCAQHWSRSPVLDHSSDYPAARQGYDAYVATFEKTAEQT